MKRTSLHLDNLDLKALERLARIETQRSGSRVSASQIVRRLIRKFLHNLPPSVFAQDQVFNKWPDEGILEAVIVRDEDGQSGIGAEKLSLSTGGRRKKCLGRVRTRCSRLRFPTSLGRIEKQAREKLSWKERLTHKRRDGSLVTVHSRWNIQRNPKDKSLTVVEVNAHRRGSGSETMRCLENRITGEEADSCSTQRLVLEICTA